MAFELLSARHWARLLMLEKLGVGMVVIDATMGNGGDTEWLCEAVGETGKVYAFDVQQQALERTQARLTERGLTNRAQLIRAGHERVLEFVLEPVDAVLFNLGWLPGGDKSMTTNASTTMLALAGCAQLMAPGALMTICAYPGHEEGRREYEAVLAWAKSLPGERFQSRVTAYLNQKESTPAMIAIHRIR